MGNKEIIKIIRLLLFIFFPKISNAPIKKKCVYHPNRITEFTHKQHHGNFRATGLGKKHRGGWKCCMGSGILFLNPEFCLCTEDLPHYLIIPNIF